MGENARYLAVPGGKRSSFVLIYSLAEGTTNISINKDIEILMRIASCWVKQGFTLGQFPTFGQTKAMITWTVKQGQCAAA